MSEPQHDIYSMAVEQNQEGQTLTRQERINRVLNDMADARPFKQIKVDNDIFDEVIKQTGQRTPATCFDWELSQAILHINKAISVTDSTRAHFLVSAKNIIQGVKER